MDVARLSEAIRAAVSAGVYPTGAPPWYIADSDAARIWEATHVHAEPIIINQLVEHMAGHPELARFSDTMMLVGTGAFRLTLTELAHWALATSLQRGADAAATALADFAATRDVKALAVVALAGIQPEGVIELTPRISLLPIAMLPPSRTRDIFTRNGQMLGIGPQIGATAALVSSFSIPEPLVPASIVNEAMQRLPGWGMFEEMADARRALTLVGPCGVLEMGRWTQVTDPRVPPPLSAGWSSGAVPPYGVSAPLAPFDPADAASIVGRYLRAHDLRAKLAIPLDRLGQAMREPALADKAIDLGIAIEALLGHDMGAGEITYRLGQRGAWLIGEGPEDRRRCHRLLNNVYALRSKAVHTGTLDTSEKKLKSVDGVSAGDTLQMLTEGFRLCALLIRKVIELGRWPDWEATVLGGAP